MYTGPQNPKWDVEIPLSERWPIKSDHNDSCNTTVIIVIIDTKNNNNVCVQIYE